MKKETILFAFKNFSPLFYVRTFLLLLFVILILVLKGQIAVSAKKTSLNLLNLTSQNQLINQQALLKRQYNEFYPLLPSVRALLPNQDYLSLFVTGIDSAARRSGLDSAAVSFGGEPSASSVSPNIKELAIVLNAGGTGIRLADFFKELATMPYFVGLNSINIDASGGIDGTALMKGDGVLFLR